MNSQWPQNPKTGSFSLGESREVCRTKVLQKRVGLRACTEGFCPRGLTCRPLARPPPSILFPERKAPPPPVPLWEESKDSSLGSHEGG